jgi:hypothetical protein
LGCEIILKNKQEVKILVSIIVISCAFHGGIIHGAARSYSARAFDDSCNHPSKNFLEKEMRA